MDGVNYLFCLCLFVVCFLVYFCFFVFVFQTENLSSSQTSESIKVPLEAAFLFSVFSYVRLLSSCLRLLEIVC